MKTCFFVLSVLILLTNCSHKMSTSGQKSVIANAAKPQLISNRFSFTEGPASDKAGNVYFTDQPNDKIWKYDIEGNLSVFMSKTGRSNGMYFDSKGNLVSCADEKNQIWSISPEKEVTVLVEGYNGLRLNGPNDVWVHPNGNMYFTDPLYPRDYWTGNPVRVKEENVYFLPKGSNQPQIAATNNKKPNGIVGTADGKVLFVADIGGNKTYKYAIHSDGTLSEPTLFINQGSDGMTIDNQGNLYLTGNGVTIYNQQGVKIDHIDIPEKWTSNVCFGGANRNKLFITASPSFYMIEMNVKGLKP